MNVHQPGSHYQVWDYIVELPPENGRDHVRLVIRDRTYRLDLPDVGGQVPVLVNKKRTKAAFDLKGASINAVDNLKRKQKAREARDKERFERKLRE